MTEVLLAVLITLCICNAVVLSFGIFYICKTVEKIFLSKKEPAFTAPKVDEEEMAKARKRFDEEMEAFQELMNYNQETAYGIKSTEV